MEYTELTLSSGRRARAEMCVAEYTNHLEDAYQENFSSLSLGKENLGSEMIPPPSTIWLIFALTDEDILTVSFFGQTA